MGMLWWQDQRLPLISLWRMTGNMCKRWTFGLFIGKVHNVDGVGRSDFKLVLIAKRYYRVVFISSPNLIVGQTGSLVRSLIVPVIYGVSSFTHTHLIEQPAHVRFHVTLQSSRKCLWIIQDHLYLPIFNAQYCFVAIDRIALLLDDCSLVIHSSLKFDYGNHLVYNALTPGHMSDIFIGFKLWRTRRADAMRLVWLLLHCDAYATRVRPLSTMCRYHS